MINIYIERQIYKKLVNHLVKKEIAVLIGPRQSGKTTILKKLQDDLKTGSKQVLYYNLDIKSDKEIVQDQTSFLRFLANQTGKKPTVIIIDEVQRLENPGLYLKGIYDTDLPYKLIVSGSSSLEIKAKISEPLTGRKKIFYLSTLNFDEFVRFKNKDITKLKPIAKVYLEEFFVLLDEYVRFGGYPKVVLQKTQNDKIEALEEIYSSYIDRDVKGFFQVKNESSYSTLITLLAGQIGGLLNKNLLSANIGSNRTTLDNYLKYLEASFVIGIVRPFFRNPKKELLKTPKVYFKDLGLRNMIVKNFNCFFERDDKGKLMENFVYLNLLNELSPTDKVNHWRTKTKAEVDFVVQKGLSLFPVEVKAQKLKKPAFSRSFRSFLSAYKPKKAFLVSLNLEKESVIDTTKIKILPFYKKLF
jgi:predicted AAA+ superfamily ATPase